jgi:hypothetical protein
MWAMRFFPGGANDATDGYTSLHLVHFSRGNIAAQYEFSVLGNDGTVKMVLRQNGNFQGVSARGYQNFVHRSYILDHSTNILDHNGALAVVVSIKEEERKKSQPFAPKNPLVRMMQEMFLDESTADVSFHVKVNDTKTSSSVSFHAHSQILQGCAPMLADLFESNSDEEMTSVPITDVRPDIFRLLLWYIYGGKMEVQALKAHAKEIVDAADKYSIVNLKLEAEAAYVNTTTITIENAMDNLLYADAKNRALLKETVIDFFAENDSEAVKKVSFNDVPGHVMKDLLVATARKKEVGKATAKDDYDVMRVSELRRKLDEMGLDVDGSRETMIEALNKSAKRS